MNHFCKSLLTVAGMLSSAIAVQAELVAHFDMSLDNGCIRESVSGERFAVEGNFAPADVDGAVGKALVFDGYTSRVDARLGNILGENAIAMTVSMWVALPCYPIIQIDTQTTEMTAIASCLDTESKSGFGFFIGFDGKYSFRTYVSGWPVRIDVDRPLPVYQWNHLVAVVNTSERSVKLYNNGEEVGSGKANGTLSFSACDFYMGQGRESRMSGPFELMSFNGLIDDISIWNQALAVSDFNTDKPENEPNLDIPASRFADEILRPRFHGMPAAGWTNECHGMCYADGRYHLFFQKNADGPYMARLHWGHISSENLYDWREERIALAPGDWYDIKGCWSGCVFSDEEITGGKPNILYTAVDYAKATIAQAAPVDENLEIWSKSASNPIINGRPTGLSDDFRDPYFFRKDNDAYIIVGSSKGGVGTTTLHKYNPTTGRWSNDGDLFFSGTSASREGTFWEMPNITPMPDGRWLFTVTPLGTSQGVRTLYWTGDISDEGKFVPDSYSSTPRLLEMNSREGFGLLSPTVYRQGDRTIALGIVPDKLPSASNWKLGWAHCYSLPREWTLADDGTLVQRPFEGLSGLRTDVSFSRQEFTLEGSLGLGDVKGRELELQGIFEVGTDAFGFNIFSSGSDAAVISYNPASGEIIADFSNLPRLQNDNGVYDGVYRCPLPKRPAQGEQLKLNIFVDHSILDIFVNDRWATSVRVFPTDADADGVEAFAASATKVKNLRAWVLAVGGNQSGAENITAVPGAEDATVTVCNLQGMTLRADVPASSALDGLPAGLYIVNGRKQLKK